MSNREQIMRGKNLEFDAYSRRGKKGAAASPWSRSPHANTRKAAEVFAANARKGPTR